MSITEEGLSMDHLSSKIQPHTEGPIRGGTEIRDAEDLTGKVTDRRELKSLPATIAEQRRIRLFDCDRG